MQKSVGKEHVAQPASLLLTPLSEATKSVLAPRVDLASSEQLVPMALTFPELALCTKLAAPPREILVSC